MSLFRRIWLTIIGFTLAAFIGSLLVNTLTARSYLEKQLFIKNQDNATALALSMSQQSDKDPVTMELLLSALFDQGHYQSIRLTDPAGNIIAEREDTPDSNAGVPGWFTSMLPFRVAPGIAHITDGWKQYGTIALASHSKFAYQDLWKGTLELIGWFTIAGLLAGGFASLMLRLITRPLDQVVAQAHAIAERRFISVEEPKAPELKSVVVAMNDMVGRVKQMFAEEAARLDALRKKLELDPLTGLANRELFMNRLRDALENENAAPCGTLAIIRLCNLAELNRKLGRNETDKFIQAIAKMLAASSGADNGLAARLNGTDFALLEPQKHAANAIAERLAEAMTRLRDEKGIDLDGLFHIGAIRYQRGEPFSRVLPACDQLLAQAESQGVNSVVAENGEAAGFDAIPSETWRDLITLALREERIKLVNFPVVALEKPALLHREGVVRLQTEHGGQWRPAGDFMPFALRLQLTPNLDLGVVKLALQILCTENCDLAINLSADTFANPDFRSQFIAHIHSQKNLADRLWVEVPEDAAIAYFDSFRELCRNLKSLGCRIGLQNFGRKLAVGDKLADLGVDYVKIDSVFVRGVDQHEGNREFLASLCKMVHSIGIKVIAVGVQTTQELDTLTSIGLDGATGPGVSDPS